MIVLLKDPDSLAPRRLSIEKPEIVLGKNVDCDVVLSSAKVSRRHARIAVHDGGLVIEDLKSTNGTFVNGQALSGASPLGENDEVRIADFFLQVQRGEVKPAEVKPSDPTVDTTIRKELKRASQPAAAASPEPEPKAAQILHRSHLQHHHKW